MSVVLLRHRFSNTDYTLYERLNGNFKVMFIITGLQNLAPPTLNESGIVIAAMFAFPETTMYSILIKK